VRADDVKDEDINLNNSDRNNRNSVVSSGDREDNETPA